MWCAVLGACSPPSHLRNTCLARSLYSTGRINPLLESLTPWSICSTDARMRLAYKEYFYKDGIMSVFRLSLLENIEAYTTITNNTIISKALQLTFTMFYQDIIEYSACITSLWLIFFLSKNSKQLIIHFFNFGAAIFNNYTLHGIENSYIDQSIYSLVCIYERNYFCCA